MPPHGRPSCPLPQVIEEHTQPRMLHKFLCERTKLAKAPNYISLNLQSPLVLQLLHFLHQGGFAATVAVERLAILLGDESGIVGKA